MNFGKIICDLRKQKGITQEELAAQLGITAAAVSKWEKGYSLPDILMLCSLADFFDVTADQLLGRERKWQYAVIAAQTMDLGRKIAALAEEYGIQAKEIFTDYAEATALTREDCSIRYIIAGFHSGWYDGNSSVTALVSVHPTDREVLDALRLVFEKYLDPEEHQYIIN